MPKYYVQSGNLKLVTTAANSRGAAIWAVHRALSQALPFLRDETPAAETQSSLDLARRTSGGSRPPLADALEQRSCSEPRLNESIQVSEQGFDRADSQTFDTLDVVTEWNQLLVAIDRLQKRLAEATES